MEQLTTYRVKGKTFGLLFLFKYCLNGSLKAFSIEDGTLDEKQFDWLLQNFPTSEAKMQEWQKNKKVIALFEITPSPADISFNALWNFYNHKVKRVEAEKCFNKLKDVDKIKCFTSIPGYDKYLQKKRVAKAHLSTFINQRYFEDDWSSVQ